MNLSQFNALRHWFNAYVEDFRRTDADGLRNIQLKIDHTHRVCDNMRLLAAGEGLSADEELIASTIALLHDVGRFPQYRRWRTFRDSESDNHARLSIEVLRAQNILDSLKTHEVILIEEAVRFHNLLSVPQRLKSPTSRFLRLIRDADKLDIWHVFLDYFTTPELERASATMLGLPETPGVSPDCLEQLSAGHIVHLKSVACINDFKLLLVSWMYDLNFTTSIRLFSENHYLESLSMLLPDDAGIKSAIDSARKRMSQNTAAFSS